MNSNDPITDLSSLTNLSSIAGSLFIENNPKLTSLDGLSNLSSIGGILWITHNDSLLNVSLTDLADVNSITISDNPVLVSIEGFDELTSLGDNNFGLRDLPALKMINGFSNLTHVGEDFTISNCPELFSINAFYSLTYVGENFTIKNINKIVDLDPFDNLATVNEELVIEDNDELIDCCAIKDLINSGNIGDGASISNNPMECSSVNEVIANACTVSVPEINKEEVIFYPNPVGEILWIKNLVSEVYFSLSATSGKILQKGVLQENKRLDLSDLEAGMYFLKIENESLLKVEKIIKVND
jgi:hypothetical protein